MSAVFFRGLNHGGPGGRDGVYVFDPAIRSYQLRDAALFWVLIPAAVITSGKGLDRVFELPVFPVSLPLLPAISLLLLSGLLLIWKSMRDLAAAGGTPNPRRPPKKLVTTGSYALCRHPMFLGYDLAALAVVLLWGSYGMLCISYPIFILLQIRFLRREEHVLSLKFNRTFNSYREKTPFLLPYIRSKHFFSDK